MAFNGRFILNLAYFAACKGGNSSEIIQLSNKTESELMQDTCIIDDITYNSLVEYTVESTGDEYFGLHAGENLNLAAAGLIAQIVQTSQTVKQALQFCCEFANLGCSVLPLSLIEENNYYKIVLTPDKVWSHKSLISLQHTVDGVLAFTIKEFYSLTRQKRNPIEVHLPWKRPKSENEYVRVFGCGVKYNQPEIAILLEKSYVEQPITTVDYNLLSILLKHAEEKSIQINKSKGFASIVKQSMIKLTRPEFPTIRQVSYHLNISSRTLQRKLKEEGLTYKEIIDELRKDFAISYLKRPDLSLREISYLLGYADTSAFNRSFKRWTGQTPKEYQKIN
ncbi:MAG: AraC family transcriptional regulator ligand-binding domain-containing protein [Candidatus Kapaibacterium sp.]